MGRYPARRYSQSEAGAMTAERERQRAERYAAARAQYRDCPRSTGPLRRLCDEGQGRCANGCEEMKALGLHDDGSFLPRSARPLCGAKTRAGGSCQCKVIPGKRRCKFHGGMSTGAKTAEGRARIAAAQRKRWQAFRDRRAIAV